MKPNGTEASNESLERFRAIYKDFPTIGTNRGRETEADTRANILDRIIHEVLEWPREAVVRERHSKAGYLDYELSRGHPILVIEAKARGETFVIPYKKTDGPRRLKIGGTLSTERTLRECLEQVQSYCNENGIRYAVATNGYSFIVFRAISEGASWRDGEAIIFHGPKVIESSFTSFWNLLSYEAVQDGKLESAFQHVSSEIRHFHRPIESIVDADATYARNPINIALRPYVDRFFGDIAKQSTIEVLRNCYVHSKPINIIDEDLNIVIRDSVPQFAASQSTQIQTDSDSEGGKFESDLREKIGLRIGSGSVVLLIGGIGSGKTTFLLRFFSVVAPDLSLPEGPIFRLHLDFLGAPDGIQELDSFLWKKVAQVLRENDAELNQIATLEKVFSERLEIVRGIFQNDLERLRKKIPEETYKYASDPQIFSTEALKYCCRGRRLPVVVFDNVDQLGNDLQTHIFSTAEYFANHLGCLSILVLREETYATAQMQKQLTAYTIKPYHLSSPSFRTMIKLRIEYATNDASNSLLNPDLFSPTKYDQQDILDFLNLLRISVFRKNQNILRMIEAVSFGNMRFALEMFNSFIISGATNVPKILEKFRDGGYNVAFHEFAKSVILGDYRFYKESRSPIINVFHQSSSRNSSHFTTLRILSYLEKTSESHVKGDGFVDLNGLVTSFADVFDNEDDCIKGIERLIALRKQLVELDTRRTDTLAGAYAIRISTAGKYFLDYLVNAFAYLDLVWQDTPLLDRGTSDQLSRMMHSVIVEERFARVEMFLDYLGGCESKEIAQLAGDRNEKSVFGPFVPRIKALYTKEKAHIRKLLLKAKHSRYPEQ